MKATLPPETLITVIRSDRLAPILTTVRESFYWNGKGFDDWHTDRGRIAVNAFLVQPFAEFPPGTPVFRSYARSGWSACHVVRDGLS